MVVAIIGGTLLGLALTRPRFGWVQRLEESSRRSAETATTIVAFVMGGYAYGALYVILHRQLGSDIDKLLRGSGIFFTIYAGCVHFEPFSETEGSLERGVAIFLYSVVAAGAITLGAAFVEYTLNGSISLILIKAALVVAGACGRG